MTIPGISRLGPSVVEGMPVAVSRSSVITFKEHARYCMNTHRVIR